MVHIQLSLIYMALWNFVLFFFQSPDIITSHIPLSNITNPSRAFSHSLSLFLFSPLSPFPVHHSSLQCPAIWPSPCKTSERWVPRLLEFVWRANSSSGAMLMQKAENSQNTCPAPAPSPGKAEGGAEVTIPLVEGGASVCLRKKAPSGCLPCWQPHIYQLTYSKDSLGLGNAWGFFSLFSLFFLSLIPRVNDS